MITQEGAPARLDDVVGNWWTVLVYGNSPRDVLPERSLQQLETLGARLAAVVPETQRQWARDYMARDVLVLGDHTGALKKWFEDRPTPMVFLRPDRFVAGACLNQDGPATLNAILLSMTFTGASYRPVPSPATQAAP